MIWARVVKAVLALTISVISRIRLIGQNVLIKTAVTLVNTGVQRFNLFLNNFEGGQNVLIKSLETLVNTR